jgi:purine-binding chemotaxis protein CheW
MNTRAVELTSAPPEFGAGQAGRADKYLTVSLGDDRFGIPVSRVKEIIECGQIVSLPMAPEAVRGTINLRGKVVPVIDLAVRFGRSAMTIGRRTCIVIAEIEGGRLHHVFDVGLLVDAVNEVVDIPPEEIERAPDMDGAIRTDFASGMGKVRDVFVLLLRIEALVDVADLVQCTRSPLSVKGDA